MRARFTDRTHNPKVVGSSPTPATTKMTVKTATYPQGFVGVFRRAEGLGQRWANGCGAVPSDLARQLRDVRPACSPTEANMDKDNSPSPQSIRSGNCVGTPG